MYTVTTAKEFDHLVLTHYSRMFQLDCTPDIARHILELYNEGNRNIRPKNVERLARLMRGGHWKCKRGTMPLKFDKNGRLFGGQHRLEAVIVADMTVTFFVMLDLDVDLRDIDDDVSPHQNQDNDPNLKKRQFAAHSPGSNSERMRRDVSMPTTKTPLMLSEECFPRSPE